MSDDKPVIRSTGMSGYSEQGVPDNWDFGIGSVSGYRWWWWHVPPKFAGYTDEEWVNGRNAFSYLIGAYRGEWEPGRIEAKCKASKSSMYNIGTAENFTGEHEPPEFRTTCGCGFWGYFSEGLRMEDVLYRTPTPKIEREAYMGGMPTIKVPVFGVIEGSGRVIIGEKGFRSQYARLKALCLPKEAKNALGKWCSTTPNRSLPGYATFEGIGSFEESLRAGVGGLSMTDLTADQYIERLTEAESILQELYPETRIMPDRNSLMKNFPPDKYYGG